MKNTTNYPVYFTFFPTNSSLFIQKVCLDVLFQKPRPIVIQPIQLPNPKHCTYNSIPRYKYGNT